MLQSQSGVRIIRLGGQLSNQSPINVRPKFLGLDVLRGCAALAVVLSARIIPSESLSVCQVGHWLLICFS